MVTRRTCQRRYRQTGTAATLYGDIRVAGRAAVGPDGRFPVDVRGALHGALAPEGRVAAQFGQAAPRCRASQTAVDSRTPSSTARPQCAIQRAIPSGVPEQ